MGGQNCTIKSAQKIKMEINEFGMWDRTLSGTELSLLWNDGVLLPIAVAIITFIGLSIFTIIFFIMKKKKRKEESSQQINGIE